MAKEEKMGATLLMAVFALGFISGGILLAMSVTSSEKKNVAYAEWEDKKIVGSEEGYDSYGVGVKLGSFETKSQAATLMNTQKTICLQLKKQIIPNTLPKNETKNN